MSERKVSKNPSLEESLLAMKLHLIDQAFGKLAELINLAAEDFKLCQHALTLNPTDQQRQIILKHVDEIAALAMQFRDLGLDLEKKTDQATSILESTPKLEPRADSKVPKKIDITRLN